MAAGQAGVKTEQAGQAGAMAPHQAGADVDDVNHKEGMDRDGVDWVREATRLLAACGVRAGSPSAHVGRHFSMRDAAKVCRRVRGMHGGLLGRCQR